MTLQLHIEREKTSSILDADIKSFFNHLNHEWIIKFVEFKIKDPSITRLLKRILKSGVIENFQYEATEEGSGQGSVLTELEPEEIGEDGVGRTLTCIGFRSLPDDIAHAISKKYQLYK